MMSDPYYDYSPAGVQDFRLKPSSPVLRRLPPVPRFARPISRPLPTIPHPLTCKTCKTCITSTDVLLPVSAIPHSRAFKGFSGKATLFTEIYNVQLSRPAVQLMATGAHTMQEISCKICSSYLGWKILRAHDRSEKWKEGTCLLELESLCSSKEGIIVMRAPPRQSIPSDSEDSS